MLLPHIFLTIRRNKSSWIFRRKGNTYGLMINKPRWHAIKEMFNYVKPLI